jgi:hypothetical protein
MINSRRNKSNCLKTSYFSVFLFSHWSIEDGSISYQLITTKFSLSLLCHLHI